MLLSYTKDLKCNTIFIKRPSMFNDCLFVRGFTVFTFDLYGDVYDK